MRKNIVAVILISFIIFKGVGNIKTYATLSSCSTSVSSGSVSPNSSTTLNFNVSNSSDTNIAWVKIISPSGDFNISGGGAGGWSASVDSSFVITFTGSLSPGNSQTFSVNVSTGSNETGGSWTVKASDSNGGDEPITCSGGTSVSIVNAVAPSATPEPEGPVATTAPGVPTATTAPASTSSGGSSSGSNSSTSSSSSTPSVPTATPTPTPIPDTTRPFVKITTSFDKPVAESPLISGEASDNKAIDRVEYSTDGGSNWLPATITARGARFTNFSFTPPPFDDGDYQIQVRARDTSNNYGLTDIYTLVIDKIPPQIGTSIISLGWRILKTDQQGMLTSLVGTKNKITVSAIGGPRSIELKLGDRVFPLKKNRDTGLWSGTIESSQPFKGSLVGYSVDGAGNKTERELQKIVFLENKQITYKGKGLSKAELSVYTFEPITSQFVLWDGSPYQQKNPQLTKADGKYSLVLPPGRYYLQVKAGGYKSVKTNIFAVKDVLPIMADIEINSKSTFNFIPATVDLNIEDLGSSKNTTVNMPITPLPSFSLKSGNVTITDLSLHGEETVITMLNTWSSYSGNQLTEIEKALEKKPKRFIVIVPHESEASVSIFKKRGGYTVPIVADQKGVLVESLSFNSQPLHIIIDKKGMIKKRITGSLRNEELISLTN